ncbi:LiaI-LiaF-like domain-containing protein [Runella zeae]|uniref:LiaI-LiaF-like domain-containing protein n=1 Tax=Runella zeae TaxID=94255 RepID=UPI00040A8EE1|nr:DUF5668 domain-containing protein [Runella zeae]
MKQSSNTLFWGAILLGLGLVMMAKTLGWFYIDWGLTLRFWPVLLILAGVSLLFRQSWSGIATAVLIAIAIPSAIINAANKKLDRWSDNGIEFHLDDDDDDDDDDNYRNDEYKERSKVYSKDGETHFSEPFAEGISDATLKFGAGAGEFKIEGTTSQLIEADADTQLGNYVMTTKRNETEKASVVNFEMEGNGKDKNIRIRDFDNMDNQVKMSLNNTPIWSFDLGLGAGKADFDFSTYKVKKVKIGAGAAEVNLKLGDSVENEATVEVEAGVASIEIEIPESVGCELKIEGALNSKDLDNFEKISGGLYRTSNYDTATKKISVSYKGGLSQLEINRY